jgi:hypothetical protein
MMPAMEQETIKETTELGLRKCMQGRCPQPSVCVGVIILLTIVIAAGMSDVVLLSTTNCPFNVEVIPIFLTLLFVVSVVRSLIYTCNSQNTSPLMQEQGESLIPNEDTDTCTSARIPRHNTARWRTFYKRRVSTTAVITFCLLDCIPIVLCVLWIYALMKHSAFDDLHESICKTRFWYSVAQSVLFTFLSFVGLIVALRTVISYLWQSDMLQQETL